MPTSIVLFLDDRHIRQMIRKAMIRDGETKKEQM